ncbi:cyclin family protein [Desulfoscipio gibsoniae]|uniref:Uncharacterized protein n=1 Tax=Desulfoscipio gibsoniae DSM 7213 TaxID=767817 RepID=R4KD57_9FIRM|nr:cyclin family protein [Desulfoscipio gibsoniae]AGL01113.1 hypothetical protein Desgi_1641 [Desulfoscipio gibsoniae DSM 7213]
MPDKQCLSGNGKKTGAGNKQKDNVIDINKYRWWRAGQHLRTKLAEFADNEMLLDEVGIARELYFSVMDPDFADEEDEFLMERFFEWFIFDYKIRGRTLLQYVKMTGRFNYEETELLKKWAKTRISLYQVVKISDEQFVTLKDLLKGGKVSVCDPDVVRELAPGHILYIRILPVGDGHEFSTGGLILPAYSKDYIISRVKLDAELYWSKQGVRGKWDAYLQRKAHVINALVIETASIVWGLEEHYDKEIGAKANKTGDFTPQLAQRVTDLFLDYFYDRWINEPMDILLGQTPLEASRTRDGRKKLQTILGELSKVEKGRAQKGEIFYDLSKLFEKLNLTVKKDSATEEKSVNDLDDFAEDSQGYAEVLKLIRDGLTEMGYPLKQVNHAEKLWRDYSQTASPNFKKPETWAAAVIYAMARSTGDKLVNQNTLARQYNISASTISNNYRNICRAMQINKDEE